MANFPYAALLTITTPYDEFIYQMKSLEDDDEISNMGEMIKRVVSEEYSCAVCREPYDTFPTFDVFTDHIIDCVRRANK